MSPARDTTSTVSGDVPGARQRSLAWPQEEGLAERRRVVIVAAAYRVFADRGYRQATIADIARELGIGHGTIYRYFANKREILESVLGLALDRITAAALADDPDVATSADELRAQALRIGDRLFKVFDRDPGGTRLVLFEAPSIDPALARRVREVLDGFAEVTAKYLENGVRRGFVRADVDVAASARAINGMLLARALDPLHGGAAVERERFAAAVGRLLLDGVAERGA